MALHQYELRALRSRLCRLQEIYASLLKTVNYGHQFPTLLEKFNALSAHYYGLESDLISTLRSALVIPCDISNIDAGKVPNVLLRTRLDPEIEEKLLQAQQEVSLTEANLAQIKFEDVRIQSLLEYFEESKDGFDETRKAPAINSYSSSITDIPSATSVGLPNTLESAIIYMHSGQ